jgi:hypothetical protein
VSRDGWVGFRSFYGHVPVCGHANHAQRDNTCLLAGVAHALDLLVPQLRVFVDGFYSRCYKLAQWYEGLGPELPGALL